MSIHKTAFAEQTHYQKEKCAIGIVHLGYGQFHKAHQAVYFDDYMEKNGDWSWGIAAVNLRKEASCNFALSKQSKESYILKTSKDGQNHSYRRCQCRVNMVK